MTGQTPTCAGCGVRELVTVWTLADGREYAEVFQATSRIISKPGLFFHPSCAVSWDGRVHQSDES